MMNRAVQKIVQAVMLISLLSSCDSADKPTLNLYLAIQREDVDQIERHIRWGTDINQVDVDGRRPMHVAATQGELVVIRLLVKNGADLNALDLNGHSPLHLAIMEGKTQVANFLIKQGADYDVHRLLFAAIEKQVTDRDVFRLLTSLGADLNHLDDSGTTPLSRAIAVDDRVLVKYLITLGADPNLPNRAGETPLYLATERGNDDIARLLKRYGAKTGP